MTTRQSTTLHMSGDGDDPNNGLAFSTIDGGDPDTGENGELYPALEVWGTIQAPDGQVLTAKMQHAMPDVRDLQSFLNDNFGRTNAGYHGDKVPKTAQEYPYQDGDFLVIGPQTFTKDGSVLSYHGANYIPQAASEDTNAQYFKDGWVASLRELLEMSKVRGYEQAIEWAKGQLGAYVGPAALSTPNYPENEAGYVVTPRQCAVIYNGIQCNKADGHTSRPETAEHTFYTDLPVNEAAPMQGHQPDVDLFQEQAAAIQRADGNHTPQDLSDNPRSAQHPDNQATINLAPNLVPGPKNAAEQERKRRLKVEIAFDESAAAYRLDPHNNGAVNDLAKAVAELRKRESDNSRIVNWDTSQAVAAVISNGLPTEDPQPEQLPEAHFAPEQTQAAPNYLAQESHPSNQQFAEAAAALPGVHLQDSVTMTPEQFQQAQAEGNPVAIQAAQAFPCPHKSSDQRPCLRPAGHEIELPNRPASPHVYATNPATLDQQPVTVTPGPNGPHVTYQPPTGPQPDPGFAENAPGYAGPLQPVQTPPPYVAPAQPVQPFQQPHLQAVPDPQPNVAVMSFHEGEPGMPAAPAMPTWQAPQQ